MKLLFKDWTKGRWVTTEVIGPVDGKFSVSKSFRKAKGKGVAMKVGFITLSQAVSRRTLPEDLEGFLIRFEAENVKRLYVEDIVPVEKKKDKVAKVEVVGDEKSEIAKEKVFETKFWAKLNSVCTACQKACKQSSKVEVLQCAQRVKI